MHQLKLDFRELMTILYSSISTGTSLENALMQADQELSCCCSAKSDILIELQEMKNKMKMNTSVLACLRDFASRCCDDDVINFYEAVSIAKQYSGGMGFIIRNAMTQMNEKIELKCEMETLIASKRQEFLIMAAVPLGIMAYMRLNSPELMCVLYETMIGRITMTIVLVVYIIAVIWGIKLIRIKV